MLSHPLLDEAAETLFVAAAVRNNSKGDADERVLKSFDEPAWNNPVVRILGPDRKDLVAPIRSEWTVPALASAMVAARKALDLEVPEYLALLAEEETSRRRGLERAVFAMG